MRILRHYFFGPFNHRTILRYRVAASKYGRLWRAVVRRGINPQTIIPVEPFDLPKRVMTGAIVPDDVIGNGHSLLAACLSRKNSPRLLNRAPVSRHQSLDLRLFGTIHDQYPVDEIQERRFCQQRHDDNLVYALMLARPPPDLIAYTWVQNGLEVASRCVIGENKPAHGEAVQFAELVQYLTAETGCDFYECGFSGPNKLPRNNVRIDDRCAKIGKHVCNHRLATGDTAG
jgi:hypothetical protein